MNYNINDIVLYGAEGICTVSEIKEQKIGSEVHKYYILKPIFNESSTVMVPIANKTLTSRMKFLPTAEDLNAALEEVKQDTDISSDTDAVRKENFHLALDSSDITALLRITKQIYTERDKQEAKGKQLHVADERMLKESEKILFDCFAYVLKLEHHEAVSCIRKSLKQN